MHYHLGFLNLQNHLEHKSALSNLRDAVFHCVGHLMIAYTCGCCKLFHSPSKFPSAPYFQCFLRPPRPTGLTLKMGSWSASMVTETLPLKSFQNNISLLLEDCTFFAAMLRTQTLTFPSDNPEGKNSCFIGHDLLSSIGSLCTLYSSGHN